MVFICGAPLNRIMDTRGQCLSICVKSESDTQMRMMMVMVIMMIVVITILVQVLLS